MLSFRSIIIVGFIFILSCRNHSKDSINGNIVQNPQSASGKNNGAKAVFRFETEKHDFGKVIEGEKVSFSFRFKNTGNADLLIADAYATCGCTVPQFSKAPIKPGETGEIEVRFNSTGKSGQLEKTVTVIANTIPNEKLLKINAFVFVPEEKK